MPVILHLSDLHRTSSPRLSNDEILSAIISDARRWEQEGIPRPDLIVVSGDIVQGARIGDPNADDIITNQYAEADEFLRQAASEFVDSDRSRIIIVPGNHDVHWVRARNAMSPLANCPDDIALKQLEADSGVRWNWNDLRAYSIDDANVYESRLELFRQFRNGFYEELRPSPLSDGVDLAFFDYPSLGLVVVGFSSWYGNDCFCHVGDIDAASLRRARELLAQSRAPVAVAVWHHSIVGGPSAHDYMDQSVVHKFIDFGFSVGLHGHQHYPEVAPFTLDLPNQTSMVVVCAGSLAVGDSELPAGERRQFNIVDINPDDESITVHVRAMSSSGVFHGSHRDDFGGNTFISLPLLHSPARPVQTTTVQLLDEASDAIRLEHFQDALNFVGDLPTSHTKRQIIIKALEGLGRSEELIEVMIPPQNADEIARVISLLVEARRFCEANSVLNAASDLLDRALFFQLSEFIEARRAFS